MPWSWFFPGSEPKPALRRGRAASAQRGWRSAATHVSADVEGRAFVSPWARSGRSRPPVLAQNCAPRARHSRRGPDRSRATKPAYRSARIRSRKPMSRTQRYRPIARRPQPSAPFWETKPLQAMTHAEWESLCDGCGQCCLLKVEEEVTGDIYLTRLACRLLDTRTCRCRDYANRRARVPDCVTISAGNVGDIAWLPQELRLPAHRGGARARVVASAGLGRSRDGAPGRAFRCAAGRAARRACARARSRATSSARPSDGLCRGAGRCRSRCPIPAQVSGQLGPGETARAFYHHGDRVLRDTTHSRFHG